MVADGGIVKAKLILDSGEFTAGWKKAVRYAFDWAKQEE